MLRVRTTCGGDSPPAQNTRTTQGRGAGGLLQLAHQRRHNGQRGECQGRLATVEVRTLRHLMPPCRGEAGFASLTPQASHLYSHRHSAHAASTTAAGGSRRSPRLAVAASAADPAGLPSRRRPPREARTRGRARRPRERSTRRPDLAPRRQPPRRRRTIRRRPRRVSLPRARGGPAGLRPTPLRAARPCKNATPCGGFASNEFDQRILFKIFCI